MFFKVQSKDKNTGFSLMSFYIITCFFLFGCERFQKPQPKNPPELKVQLKSEKCIEQVSPVFKSYLQQKLVQEDWKKAWHCLDMSLAEMQNSFEGEKKEQYHVAEVKHFFETYILKKEISLNLAKEILKLKHAIIGGSFEVITFQELNSLRKLMEKTSSLLLNLYPYIGIFTGPDKLDVRQAEDQKRLDAAILEVKKALHEWLLELPTNTISYSLPDLRLLIDELSQFSQDSDADLTGAHWAKQIPLFEKIKFLLIGEHFTVQSREEVESIWLSLVDVYKSALYFRSGISELKFNDPETFFIFDEWVEFNFKTLNQILNLKKNPVVTFNEINEFIDLIDDNSWPHQLFSKETFKKSYPKFVADFLNEKQDLQLQEFNSTHIRWLHREYQSYKAANYAFIEIFKKEKSLKSENIVQQLSQLLDHPLTQRPSSAKDVSLNGTRSVLQDIKSLLENPPPRVWTQSHQIFLDPEAQDPHLTYNDLWHFNVYRQLAIILMRVYGRPLDPQDPSSEKVMLKADFKKLYLDYSELGVELRLFDPREVDTSMRTAYEADLFTAHGNGNNRVELVELMDLFTLLYSGGSVSANEVKKMAETLNVVLTPTQDVFGYPYLSFQGLSEVLYHHFSNPFVNLPRMNRFIKQLSKEEWQSIYDSLLTVSRTCSNDHIGVDTPDLRTLTVIFHYIEQMFVLFDRDQNGFFNEAEVDLAFPRFQDFIVQRTKERVQKEYPKTYKLLEFIGYNWNGLGRDVFKFIVLKGRLPSASEILELKKQNYFGNGYQFPEAHRGQLSEVFATLKSEMGLPTAQCDLTKLKRGSP